MPVGLHMLSFWIKKRPLITHVAIFGTKSLPKKLLLAVFSSLNGQCHEMYDLFLLKRFDMLPFWEEKTHKKTQTAIFGRSWPLKTLAGIFRAEREAWVIDPTIGGERSHVPGMWLQESVRVLLFLGHFINFHNTFLRNNFLYIINYRYFLYFYLQPLRPNKIML